MTTTDQIAALEEGKIDIGIIRAPLTSPKIKSDLWFKDSFSLVFNKNLVKIETEAEIEKMKEETFVFFNKLYAPNYYDKLLEICANYGFVPKVVHESNNISSIIQLVKNGLGSSFVPTNILKSHNDPLLGFIELKSGNLHTDVLIVTPKEEASEIAKEAIEFLKRKRV
jgi:DNA-binding transcriptional LysR family regulator